MKKAITLKVLAIALALVALNACSGSSGPSAPKITPTYTLGGTISGLVSGATVTLNGASAGSSGAIGNGPFTLPTALDGGASYDVTATASSGSCAVTNGSGTVGSANVTNIAVVCKSGNYTLGGTVSGLSPSATVTLENSSDGVLLGVTANGSFTFTSAAEPTGTVYSISIRDQPAGETCTITNGSGTIGTTNVTNIMVVCAAITRTIGGTVTGLSGSVTLLDNGSSSLTLSANGAFTFKTAVAVGSPYGVTVSTQPSGQICTIADGSGTVGSANVTNVVVACSASGTGPSGGVGFWMPFSAVPVAGTSGGQTGLFLIASNSIGSSPPPQPAFVTTTAPTLMGISFQGSLYGSTSPTSITPDLLIYAAAGTDGNTHLYGLVLANPSNSGTVPTPTQITSLSVPPSKSICSGGQAQTNLTVPTTLQIIVYVATPETGSSPGTDGYCAGVPGGTYYIVNYSDSPTAAPSVTTIPGGNASFAPLVYDGNFAPLYASTGILGGLLYWDSTTQDENFYATSAFTASTTLLTGIAGTPVACISINSVENGARDYLGGVYLASVSTGSRMSAYEFTASGTAYQFFDGDAGACVTDPTNLYFIGTANGGTTQGIYQEPVSAVSAPKTLLGGLPAASETDTYSLIGSNGSLLVLDNFTVSGTGSSSTTFLSLPVGATSTSATTIGGPYPGSLYAGFLASPAGGAASGDILFLTENNPAGSTVSFASQALNPNGTGSILSTTPNAIWQSFGVFTTELSGYVLQITGITDTTGTYGGATLNLVNTGSLGSAPIALTTTGGAAYKVPANNALSVTGFFGTTVAVGEFISAKAGTVSGAAIDVSQHVILPLNLTNTNVAPLF